jgi:YesN/AraC family two-component response regulator
VRQRCRSVRFILILSDINMPGVTGLELRPKAKALRPDFRIITITAFSDDEIKQSALVSLFRGSLHYEPTAG